MSSTVIIHIKLLSLQLRNLNSVVTTQNKYSFKVNKQMTWLANEMLNSFSNHNYNVNFCFMLYSKMKIR